MTARILVNPYGPSDTCAAIRDYIEVNRPSASRLLVTKLRTSSSRANIQRSDLFVNYGSTSQQTNVFAAQCNSQGARLLNHPNAVRNASNKINAFRAMMDVGVPTVEWTTNREFAERWVSEGGVVYARTVLNGHSGEGIEIAQDSIDTLVDAPLYTKGITVQRREFRIHVLNGQVIFVQQKKRANGYRENPNYSERIRNHHTGWIYANADVRPNDAAIRAAVQAVSCLNLDFGAVDIITRQEQAWVLEVNTAAGREGTNLAVFCTHLMSLALTGGMADDMSIQAVGGQVYNTPEPTPAPITEPVTRTRVPTEGPGSISEPIRAVMEPTPVIEVPQPVVAQEVVESVTARINRIGTPPTLVEGAFYVVRMIDSASPEEGSIEATQVIEVAKYCNNNFWICGVEVEFEPDEVTVVRRLEL